MNTTFNVDLNLLIELGEQLISKDEIAIMELVKNSYDADARKVEVTVGNEYIRIADDGTGMDENDIKYGWLLVGTSVKKRRRTTKLNRRVLGEKGIGRLAVLRLGRQVDLVTKKENCEAYRLNMKFSPEQMKSTESNQIVPLDRLPIIQEKIGNVPKFPDNKGTGTIITITSLLDDWGKNKIDSLMSLLSKLISPFGEEVKDFAITMNNEGIDIPLTSPDVFRNPPYSIDAQVRDDGSYVATFKYNGKSEPMQMKFEGNFSKMASVGWRNLDEGGPGNFGFRLSVWDLDDVSTRGWRTDIKTWSGISLIKNKFLVVQPSEDWLGFNIRRVIIFTHQKTSMKLLKRRTGKDGQELRL